MHPLSNDNLAYHLPFFLLVVDDNVYFRSGAPGRKNTCFFCKALPESNERAHLEQRKQAL